MRRPLLVALGAYVIALALFAGFVAVPFLTKKHDIPAEVPSPPPLYVTSLDVMQPHQRLCMTDVAISAESQEMRFRVGTYFKPGPPLAVTVRSPGYSAGVRVPAGYADNATLAVPVPRPPSSRLVTVCIRNDGRRKIALYAAEDRAQSRVNVFRDGERLPATPSLSFNEHQAHSIAQRAGVTAGRIAVFRGLLDHTWIVWLLVFLTLIVVPVLIAAGLMAAMRDQLRTVSSGAASGAPMTSGAPTASAE